MKTLYTFDYLEKLTNPAGSIFTWPFGCSWRNVEKTGENTFEIHDTVQGFRSATVDGDTLINAMFGNLKLSNIKFE